jgi:predicted transcriptional regulator
MAAIDSSTIVLLSSVLGNVRIRKLFTTIATKRIAEGASLESDSTAAEGLSKLQEADLIAAGQGGDTYYVTAKGLKVARELESLPIA